MLTSETITDDIVGATTIEENKSAVVPGIESTLGSIGLPAEVVDAGATVQNVVALFQSQPDMTSIVLRRAGLVVGIAMRDKLLLKLSSQYGHSLYARKSIESLAIPLTSVFSIHTSTSEALTAAIDRSSECLYDDLVAVGPDNEVWVIRLRDLIAQQAGVHALESKLRVQAEKRAQDAEVLSEMKARFLRHVTHELRAPVNAMVGLADLARSAMAAGNAEHSRTTLDKLSRSAGDVRALINNLLDLSKIEAGRMSVELEDIKLGSLVEEAEIIALGLEAQATAKVYVRCAEAERDKRVRTDSIRMRQVVTNLLSNAFKFTPSGRVDVSFQLLGRDLCVEVADTGIGIPADKLNSIFESFYQVDDPLVRRVQGTGLGLTITKHIVELLGGLIQVSSVAGKGTRFTVWFPAAVH